MVTLHQAAKKVACLLQRTALVTNMLLIPINSPHSFMQRFVKSGNLKGITQHLIYTSLERIKKLKLITTLFYFLCPNKNSMQYLTTSVETWFSFFLLTFTLQVLACCLSQKYFIFIQISEPKGSIRLFNIGFQLNKIIEGYIKKLRHFRINWHKLLSCTNTFN